MRLRILHQAQADLEGIHDYGLRHFGHMDADGYYFELLDAIELIVTQPRMSRERPELADGVRIHAHRSHVIVYRIEIDEIVVVRVLHGRQDWKRYLG
jgi:toxin ParE1/3/4